MSYENEVGRHCCRNKGKGEQYSTGRAETGWWFWSQGSPKEGLLLLPVSMPTCLHLYSRAFFTSTVCTPCQASKVLSRGKVLLLGRKMIRTHAILLFTASSRLWPLLTRSQHPFSGCTRNARKAGEVGWGQEVVETVANWHLPALSRGRWAQALAGCGRAGSQHEQHPAFQICQGKLKNPHFCMKCSDSYILASNFKNADTMGFQKYATCNLQLAGPQMRRLLESRV